MKRSKILHKPKGRCRNAEVHQGEQSKRLYLKIDLTTGRTTLLHTKERRKDPSSTRLPRSEQTNNQKCIPPSMH